MRALVLDGGGVYGIVQAAILDGLDPFDHFDCFIGTSIGSVNAAGIACGKQNEITRTFYRHYMPTIFKKNALRYYNPFNSKFSDKGLNKALQGIFRGTSYRDAKKPLFITAANVGSQTLKVFNQEDDGGWLLWEAARAATAAETYFPSWKGLADGGVFANNPSMVAVSAMSRRLDVPLNEIEILSIGTGSTPSGGSRGPKTMMGWGIWLVQALLHGASDEMHDYFVRALPVKRYKRIQFSRKSHWKIDDPENMLEAENCWERDIADARKVVEAF